MINLVAENYSSWQWEYDNKIYTAYIFCDENQKLYLKIKLTYIKSGLGAGKTIKEVLKISIGTLDKPNYGLIRQSLAKNSFKSGRASGNYSKNWVTFDNKQMPLKEVIEYYKMMKYEKLKSFVNTNIKNLIEKKITKKEIIKEEKYVLNNYGQLNQQLAKFIIACDDTEKFLTRLKAEDQIQYKRGKKTIFGWFDFHFKKFK